MSRETLAQDEQKLAVLVGINAYAYVGTLRNAVNDARRVAEVLRRHGYEVLPPCLDEAATLAGLRLLLLGLGKKVTEKTRLLFYFAGHGEVVDDGSDDGTGIGEVPQGFLVPQDGRPGEVSTLLPMKELAEALGRLPCCHLLLVLDCCYAGAFRFAETRSLVKRIHGQPRKRRYEAYLRKPSRQILCSAASDERARDAPYGRPATQALRPANSPFAEAFCQGLLGVADAVYGGRPGDGLITIHELYEYIEQQLGRADGPRAQRPQLWALGQAAEGEFLFWHPERELSLREDDDSNPYRGLRAYEGNAGELGKQPFYGRQEPTAKLRQAVAQGSQRLTVVLGASGSGKSSLVRAGLLPSLRGALPAEAEPAATEAEWQLLPPLLPGKQPLTRLAALGQTLAPGASSLAEAVRVFSERAPGRRLLLFIDQLEELSTQSGDEAARFLGEVNAAVAVEGTALRVVATLRSDFEVDFDKWESALPAPLIAKFMTPPLSRGELREIIELPAADRAVDFESPALVDRIVADTEDRPGALPLLSFLLEQLYGRYLAASAQGGERKILGRHYEEVGSVGSALHKTAADLYEKLSGQKEEQALFRGLMLRMTVPGSTARRRVPRAELRFASDDAATRERVERTLEQLVTARLLIADRDSYELTHEWLIPSFIVPALLRGPPLQGKPWPAVHVLQHEVIDAVALQSRGIGSWLLWSQHSEIATLGRVLQAEPFLFNQDEQRYLATSLFLRRAAWASALLLCIVLSGLTIFALRSRNTAERQRGVAEAEKKEALRQKQRAALDAERASQSLLDFYVERGGQELNEGRANKALSWLAEACRQGSRNQNLHLLLGRALDAMPRHKRALGTHLYGSAFTADAGGVALRTSDKLGLWDLNARTLELKATEDKKQLALSLARDVGAMRIAYVDDEDGSRKGSVSPDGMRIAIPSASGHQLIIKEIVSGKTLATLSDQRASLRPLAWDADGKRLLSTFEDGSAAIWDGASGRRLLTLRGHKQPVALGTFDPPGNLVVTIGEDHTIVEWDAETGNRVQAFPLGGESVSALAFRPDGKYLLTAGEHGVASLWELQYERRAGSARLQDGWIIAAEFSPDGQEILTATPEGTAAVWDAHLGNRVAVEDFSAETIAQAWFTPGSRKILAVGQYGGIFLLDAASGKRLLCFADCEVLGKEPGWPLGYQPVALSKDGRSLVTAGCGGNRGMSVAFWDLNTGAKLRSIPLSSRPVAVSFSEDGSLLLIDLFNEDSIVVEAKTGTQVSAALKGASPWDGGWEGAHFAALSPDGQNLLTKYDLYDAAIWDVKRGVRLHRLNASRNTNEIREFQYAMYSHDGKLIAAVSNDGGVVLWEAATGRRLAELSWHAVRLSTLALSADDQRLLTADVEGQAALWEIKTGRLLTTFAGHEGVIHSASFDATGHWVVTAGRDGTLRVWDAEHGTYLTALKAPQDEFVTANFSPDGHRIVSGSKRGRLRIWDLGTTELGDGLGARRESIMKELDSLVPCYTGYQFTGSAVAPVTPNRKEACPPRALAPRPLLSEQAENLIASGVLALRAQNSPLSRTRLTKARQIAHEAGLSAREAQAVLGLLAVARHDRAGAQPWLSESLRLLIETPEADRERAVYDLAVWIWEWRVPGIGAIFCQALSGETALWRKSLIKVCKSREP